MWFAGGKSLLHFSPVLLLLFSLLQIWVCWYSSCQQVGAIRIFPENAGTKVKLNHTKEEENRFFHKYFLSGSTFDPTNKTIQKGFHETKRRVPSCPDPLHN